MSEGPPSLTLRAQFPPAAMPVQRDLPPARKSLGTSYGRGGATSLPPDLRNSDSMTTGAAWRPTPAGSTSSARRPLGYRARGEEGKYRAATCEACRQYVKMVSTLTPPAPLPLLVTDVATVHLDLLAADNGFSPPL